MANGERKSWLRCVIRGVLHIKTSSISEFAQLFYLHFQSPYINIHIGATALHYGQACFEGLKAFAHEDGSVYMFRPDENSKR